MTKKEREVRKRPWLKVWRFSITRSLSERLAANTTLVEVERRNLAHIQNLVLTHGRKQAGRWVNIWADEIKEGIKGAYLPFVDMLIEWGELERHPSYKADDETGFPKSYRVPRAALDSGTLILDFTRQKIQPPRIDAAQASVDLAMEWARQCMQRLTVVESLLIGQNPIRDALIHDHCWRIFFGSFNLRRGGKCGRLYHHIIEMPKEGRANLKLLNSTEPLFEYDVKSCHPVLLLNLFTDPAEHQRYSDLLDVDVYDGAAAAMGMEWERAEVKDIFMPALTSESRNPASLRRNWVFKFYEKHFPIFTKEVLLVRSDLAAYLQQLESRLMVDALGTFCKQHELFWIPCHDGWMSTVSTEQQIVSKVQDLFQNELGYTVGISRVELSSGVSKLISSGVIRVYVGASDTYPTSETLEKVGDQQPRRENPWRAIVDQWRKTIDPAKVREAAEKRAKVRERREEVERVRKANLKSSMDLAEQVRKKMESMGD